MKASRFFLCCRICLFFSRVFSSSSSLSNCRMCRSNTINASSLSIPNRSASSAKIGLSRSNCWASCQVVLYVIWVIESKMSLKTLIFLFLNCLASSFSRFALNTIASSNISLRSASWTAFQTSKSRNNSSACLYFVFEFILSFVWRNFSKFSFALFALILCSSFSSFAFWTL